MSPRKITPKELVNRKKQELVQKLLRTDTRVFFNLPRDAEGNVLPLPP